MTETTGEGAGPGGYAAQLETIRSVAKWLIAAFAAVGALLVAGLSISGIGELSPSSWRLYVAGSSAALALATIAFMIKEASDVLSHEWLTLASFGDDQTSRLSNARESSWHATQLLDIDEKLEVSRHELFGYAAETRPALQKRLRLADQNLRRIRPGSRRALKWAREAEVLRQAARDTVQYANYCYTLKLFQRMRIRLVWTALVAAISIGIFAYSVNPPKISDPGKARPVATTSPSRTNPKSV